MSRRACFVLGSIVALTLARANAAAQSAVLARGDVAPHGWSKDGVIWNDRGTLPTLQQLALATAPVLWFSPDEFLLAEKRVAPAALDQRPAREVYYRTARIRTSGNEYREWRACTSEPTCRIAANISELTIRFMFYYPEDRGFGHHIHDLEVTDVKLAITAAGSGAVVRLVYVASAAHGVGWYTNELAIDKTDGVMLPLHLFVEQGKHASAPDRDADGVYTPSRDVNELPHDAWGVHDRAPLSFRLGSGFDARMFKTRNPGSQVWPSHNVPADRSVDTYQLVHALSTPFCQPRGAARRLDPTKFDGVDEADLLRGFLQDKSFCDGPHKPSKNEGWPLWLGGTIIRPFGSVMERLSLAYRFDQGRSGWALGGPVGRVPRLGGWLVARMNGLFEGHALTTEKVVGTVLEGHTVSAGVAQFDLFYTRSAGGLVDWYGSMGLDIRSIKETVSGFDTIVDDQEMAMVEGGIHVRFPLPDTWKRTLHIPFVGARIGVRTQPTNAADQTRVVLELGLGAW